MKILTKTDADKAAVLVAVLGETLQRVRLYAQKVNHDGIQHDLVLALDEAEEVTLPGEGTYCLKGRTVDGKFEETFLARLEPQAA